MTATKKEPKEVNKDIPLWRLVLASHSIIDTIIARQQATPINDRIMHHYDIKTKKSNCPIARHSTKLLPLHDSGYVFCTECDCDVPCKVKGE